MKFDKDTGMAKAQFYDFTKSYTGEKGKKCSEPLIYMAAPSQLTMFT